MNKFKLFLKNITLYTFFVFYLFELNRIQENFIVLTTASLSLNLWVALFSICGFLAIVSGYYILSELNNALDNRYEMIEQIYKLVSEINKNEVLWDIAY